MKTLFAILSILLLQSAVAKTWETQSPGYWNSANVWKGEVAPNFSSVADTFLINHPVVIDSTLIVSNGSYIYIDSAGGICGHEEMRLLGASKMNMYGVLDLDTLTIHSSKVYCYEPGNVILTNYGFLSGNGGELNIYCEFQVGPWFECKLPEYAFISGISEAVSQPGILISPNPFTTHSILNFGRALDNGKLEIFNSMGQLMKEFNAISGETFEIERDGLSNGIYFMKISNGDESPMNSTFIIE